VYVITAQTIFFFSTTTANCIGRLSFPRLKESGHQTTIPSYPANPLTLYFSESELGYDSSVREKFFACCSVESWFDGQRVCHEFEIPTVEEVAAAEAKMLDEEVPEKMTGFKPHRVQLCESSVPGLNPFLKVSVKFSVSLLRESESVMDFRISPLEQFPVFYFKLFDEMDEKRVNIPLERYMSRTGVIGSKPTEGLPRGTRWGENRSECVFPPTQNPMARIQQRYIVFSCNEDDVYLLGFEPFW
jgi:hypothetical protein